MSADCWWCEKQPAMGRYIVILGDNLPDVSLCDTCGTMYHPTFPELRAKALAGTERRTLAEPVGHAGKGQDATDDAGRTTVALATAVVSQASASPSPSSMGNGVEEGAADGIMPSPFARPDAAVTITTRLDAPPLPEERLARLGGPVTSLEAARLAAKASKKAMAQVQRVMADGVPRIDEELWEACRESGYVTSLATVQHGRLALSEAGVLEDTGKTRTTTNGCKSRVWRMKLQTALAI